MAEEDIRVKHLYYINFRRCLHVSIDHGGIDGWASRLFVLHNFFFSSTIRLKTNGDDLCLFEVDDQEEQADRREARSV